MDRRGPAAGAEILTGGELVDEDRCLAPTVLGTPSPQDKVWCEEIFGPVATIYTFTDFDEALGMANDSKFGLQAGVFTRDMGRGLQAGRTLEFGGVLINEVPTFRADQMPYGGVKDSGNTREGPAYAVRELTEERFVTPDRPLGSPRSGAPRFRVEGNHRPWIVGAGQGVGKRPGACGKCVVLRTPGGPRQGLSAKRQQLRSYMKGGRVRGSAMARVRWLGSAPVAGAVWLPREEARGRPRSRAARPECRKIRGLDRELGLQMERVATRWTGSDARIEECGEGELFGGEHLAARSGVQGIDQRCEGDFLARTE